MLFRFMILIGTASLFLINHPLQLLAQKLTPIHISVSANTVSWFPLYVGWKKGIFKEQGIDILPVRMSVRSSLAALASKQIHYITPIGSPMTAIAQGLPAKVIMIFAKRSHFVLITRPEIRSPEQLKDKRIAINSPGNTIHRQLLKLLESFGIEPGEVKLINLGPATNRALALSQGNVDAAMLHIPYDLMMEKEGFRPLAYLKDISDIPLSGIVTQSSNLQERSDEVKRLLIGALKSIAYTKSHREDVAPLLVKFVGLESTRMAKQAFDRIKGLWPDDGLATDEGLRNALALADVPSTIPPDKIFSFTEVKEAAVSLK